MPFPVTTPTPANNLVPVYNEVSITLFARFYKRVHTNNMRTNVNIADDVRQFATLYANAKGLTLGAAITELIRKAQRTETAETKTPQFERSFAGFPVFPKLGRTITTEMVRKAEEEDLD